jgi:hypothetical protein
MSQASPDAEALSSPLVQSRHDRGECEIVDRDRKTTMKCCRLNRLAHTSWRRLRAFRRRSARLSARRRRGCSRWASALASVEWGVNGRSRHSGAKRGRSRLRAQHHDRDGVSSSTRPLRRCKGEQPMAGAPVRGDHAATRQVRPPVRRAGRDRSGRLDAGNRCCVPDDGGRAHGPAGGASEGTSLVSADCSVTSRPREPASCIDRRIACPGSAP